MHPALSLVNFLPPLILIDFFTYARHEHPHSNPIRIEIRWTLALSSVEIAFRNNCFCFLCRIQHHFSQCGCNVPVKTKDLSNELFGECQFYCDRVWNNQNYYSIRSASAHLLTQFSVSQQKLSKFLYVAVVVNVKLSGFWQTDVDTSILSRRQLKLSCTNSP